MRWKRFSFLATLNGPLRTVFFLAFHALWYISAQEIVSSRPADLLSLSGCGPSGPRLVCAFRTDVKLAAGPALTLTSDVKFTSGALTTDTITFGGAASSTSTPDTLPSADLDFSSLTRILNIAQNASLDFHGLHLSGVLLPSSPYPLPLASFLLPIAIRLLGLPSHRLRLTNVLISTPSCSTLSIHQSFACNASPSPNFTVTPTSLTIHSYATPTTLLTNVTLTCSGPTPAPYPCLASSVSNPTELWSALASGQQLALAARAQNKPVVSVHVYLSSRRISLAEGFATNGRLALHTTAFTIGGAPDGSTILDLGNIQNVFPLTFDTSVSVLLANLTLLNPPIGPPSSFPSSLLLLPLWTFDFPRTLYGWAGGVPMLVVRDCMVGLPRDEVALHHAQSSSELPYKRTVPRELADASCLYGNQLLPAAVMEEVPGTGGALLVRQAATSGRIMELQRVLVLPEPPPAAAAAAGSFPANGSCAGWQPASIGYANAAAVTPNGSALANTSIGTSAGDSTGGSSGSGSEVVTPAQAAARAAACAMWVAPPSAPPPRRHWSLCQVVPDGAPPQPYALELLSFTSLPVVTPAELVRADTSLLWVGYGSTGLGLMVNASLDTREPDSADSGWPVVLNRMRLALYGNPVDPRVLDMSGLRAAVRLGGIASLTLRHLVLCNLAPAALSTGTEAAAAGSGGSTGRRAALQEPGGGTPQPPAQVQGLPASLANFTSCLWALDFARSPPPSNASDAALGADASAVFLESAVLVLPQPELELLAWAWEYNSTAAAADPGLADALRGMLSRSALAVDGGLLRGPLPPGEGPTQAEAEAAAASGQDSAGEAEAVYLRLDTFHWCGLRGRNVTLLSQRAAPELAAWPAELRLPGAYPYPAAAPASTPAPMATATATADPEPAAAASGAPYTSPPLQEQREQQEQQEQPEQQEQREQRETEGPVTTWPPLLAGGSAPAGPEPPGAASPSSSLGRRAAGLRTAALAGACTGAVLGTCLLAAVVAAVLVRRSRSRRRHRDRKAVGKPICASAASEAGRRSPSTSRVSDNTLVPSPRPRLQTSTPAAALAEMYRRIQLLREQVSYGSGNGGGGGSDSAARLRGGAASTSCTSLSTAHAGVCRTGTSPMACTLSAATSTVGARHSMTISRDPSSPPVGRSSGGGAGGSDGGGGSGGDGGGGAGGYCGAGAGGGGGVAAAGDGDGGAVTISGCLGSGAQGVVYRGRWRGLDVAVKSVLLDVPEEPRDASGSGLAAAAASSDPRVAHAITEATISASVSHPNIVATYTYALQRLGPPASQLPPSSCFTALPLSSHTPSHAAASTPSAGGPETPPGRELCAWKLTLVQELCDANSLRHCLASGLLAACVPVRAQRQGPLWEAVLPAPPGPGRDSPPAAARRSPPALPGPLWAAVLPPRSPVYRAGTEAAPPGDGSEAGTPRQRAPCGAPEGAGGGSEAGAEAEGEGEGGTATVNSAAAADAAQQEEQSMPSPVPSPPASPPTPHFLPHPPRPPHPAASPFATPPLPTPRPPHPAVALCVALHAARGLAHLHALGIVHGDVSSANVLLASVPPHGTGAGRGERAATRGGTVPPVAPRPPAGAAARLSLDDPCTYGYVAKVADFGLAGRLDAGREASHLSGPARRSSAYSAPELVRHGHSSPAGDAYAFAVVLWELAHGSPLPALLASPAGAAVRSWLTAQALAAPQHAVALPYGLLTWPDCVPRGYTEVVATCLAARPGARPSMVEVCERLAAAAGQLPAGEAQGR